MANKKDRALQERNAFSVTIIDRLRLAIEQETADVQSLRRVDYEAYNLRKSQGLLEISRLLPSLDGRPSPALIEALRGLEAAIIENQKALGVHLAAANAINDLISRAVRESQSDGTYCVDGAWLQGA